ncbi:MAG: ATP synthase F1 subunit delta [Spirochaetota bacterium]
MATSEVAKVYAGALLEIAHEKNAISKVEEELSFLAELLKNDNDLMRYFSAPGIPKESKKQFVEKVFGSELSELMVNFLKVLIDNGRQQDLPDISVAFSELLDIVNNRQKIKLVSSVKLDSDIINRIKKGLEDRFNKNIIVDEEIDPTILGGIIVQVDDLIIDASLKNDLLKLREKLLQSKIRGEVAYED